MTDCIRCGDCCDPITMEATAYDKMASWAHPALPHPDDDPGYWLKGGRDPEAVAANWDHNRADAIFITQHWTVTARYERPELDYHGVALECAFFDPTARLCLAHDARPPICRSYPWYGHEPDTDNGKRLPTRCSFWADVPAEQRPAGWVPVQLVTR